MDECGKGNITFWWILGKRAEIIGIGSGSRAMAGPGISGVKHWGQYAYVSKDGKNRMKRDF